MLPNSDRAIIEPAKLRDYLLSDVHPVGRFKARFFHAFGYRADGWKVLHDDLLRLVVTYEAKPGQASAAGQKFEVSGTLTGPNGRTGVIVSVWILRIGEDAPRFITAYPG